MTPLTNLPTVPLAKDLTRAIRDGHPWILRDAIAGAPRIANGTLVRVASKDGRPVATGFWDAGSAIAVRILHAGPLSDRKLLLGADCTERSAGKGEVVFRFFEHGVTITERRASRST